MLQIGDIVKAKNIEPLPNNTIAPPLILDQEYKVEEIHTCGCGKNHIHIGLQSKYAYVSCYDCGEELPDGDKKHWCHPSRF